MRADGRERRLRYASAGEHGRVHTGSRGGLPARHRRRHGDAPRASPELRDVHSGARGRCRHAECALLHAKQLRHAQSRRRDVSARDRRTRRADADVHDPRSPEHALEDSSRHAGVCRQRTVAVRSAHRGREMGTGRRQHSGVDRCAARRNPGPRRRAAGCEGGAVSRR